MDKRRQAAGGRPPVDTLQGLRTALTEEIARGRVVAAQLNEARERNKALREGAETLVAHHQRVSGEYDARRATYQDREDQITRLTRFLYSNYVWEMRAGDHLGMKQVDIAMRYLAVERGRWRVRVRGWWNRNVKYRALWAASTRGARRVGTKVERVMNTPAGGEEQVEQAALTDMTNWFCRDCKRVVVARRGDRCETCKLTFGEQVDKAMERAAANPTFVETVYVEPKVKLDADTIVCVCQRCHGVRVSKPGEYCEPCALKISELAERAR